jgi:two-component system chemotaxis response regulator CheY
MMLKKSLPKGRDYEICEAVNGLEGLEKFKGFQPDVTFLDLTMPVMDGTECLGKIMNISKNAIVMVVSSDIQVQSVERVITLGAFKMLKKPAGKEDIQKALTDAENKIG